MSNVISVENISKSYRLGQIGTGTLTDDLKLWWAKTRGKPNPLLKIGQENVNNRTGDLIWALRDVSFQVSQGEVLGVIGRNGAGKSTLLKVLSRVTAPTSGTIKIKGRIASLLEVGTGFHPELTGRENIYLNGAILGMNKEEVRGKFDEIVDFAEIAQFIDTPVKRYSSGMYVRLAFAVAAHLEPEILLVDEVLAVGDAEFQKKCIGKMGNVARQGRTILFVSHNMAMIQHLCHSSLLIRNGTIDGLGPTEEIINQYIKNASGKADTGDLTQIENRSGSGPLRFTRWYIRHLDSESTQTRSNAPCNLVLNYACEGNISQVKNVSITVLIKDQYNQSLFSASTKFKNSDFSVLPANGSIVCQFKSVPLLPQEYKLHLWCSVNEDVSDVIRDAGFLTVLPVDVFGTGVLPQPKHGMFIVDHSWSVEP